MHDVEHTQCLGHYSYTQYVASYTQHYEVIVFGVHTANTAEYVGYIPQWYIMLLCRRCSIIRSHGKESIL